MPAAANTSRYQLRRTRRISKVHDDPRLADDLRACLDASVRAESAAYGVLLAGKAQRCEPASCPSLDAHLWAPRGSRCRFERLLAMTTMGRSAKMNCRNRRPSNVRRD